MKSAVPAFDPPAHGSVPPLSARQRLLLGMLRAFGGAMSNLDFQKVLFLYCQQPGSGNPYDFVPYKRGAFSFTSYADRRKLIAHGLIEDDEHSWRFTGKGRDLSEESVLLTGFAKEIGDLRGDELVADTYRRFPYYATKSEIADRVLRGDCEALEEIQAAKQVKSEVPLQTIGYEGRSLECYLNLLLQRGVTVLCDVRRNPLSRKYGFSKKTLSNACSHIDIRYEHLPQLGIASEFRQDLQSQEDYDALFAEYEREWLPQQTNALQTIQGWIEKGDRVALTCYEHLPEQCHRHCVAEALETMSLTGLATRHL